jgi:hypothetical protein
MSLTKEVIERLERERFTGYRIEPGRNTQGLRVWRVVEWKDGKALGGLGSFFAASDAAAFISKREEKKIRQS